jgi:hypothetical protein
MKKKKKKILMVSKHILQDSSRHSEYRCEDREKVGEERGDITAMR